MQLLKAGEANRLFTALYPDWRDAFWQVGKVYMLTSDMKNVSGLIKKEQTEWEKTTPFHVLGQGLLYKLPFLEYYHVCHVADTYSIFTHVFSNIYLFLFN